MLFNTSKFLTKAELNLNQLFIMMDPTKSHPSNCHNDFLLSVSALCGESGCGKVGRKAELQSWGGDYYGLTGFDDAKELLRLIDEKVLSQVFLWSRLMNPMLL